MFSGVVRITNFSLMVKDDLIPESPIDFFQHRYKACVVTGLFFVLSADISLPKPLNYFCSCFWLLLSPLWTRPFCAILIILALYKVSGLTILSFLVSSLLTVLFIYSSVLKKNSSVVTFLHCKFSPTPGLNFMPTEGLVSRANQLYRSW